MKHIRTRFFIGLSIAALVLVLAIQVNWIFQSARLKEELFNEKANIVLSRTTEALRNDEATCIKIAACGEAEPKEGSTLNLEKSEMAKIDSLFNHYMRFYNFQIDYTFVLAKPKPSAEATKYRFYEAVFNKQIVGVSSQNGVELKLIFPDKKDYLLAEMGIPFFTSVLLILVVLVLFWQTVQSLLKEKLISEHTTDFLNNMTHEFKTPLTNIALAGKMITRDGNLNLEEKIRHYSGIILEENEKLTNQVEQVLSMTALERGEIPVRKCEINVHEYIQLAIKGFHLQLENHPCALQMNLNAKNQRMVGDKIHLTNAFVNLIDNAIKYAKGNSEIRIETHNEGKNLIVEVSDQGIGIDRKYQKKVFDQFFRVPTGDVHDVKGFGLGLAYVKKIIELHGGKIVLTSEKGVGTTFTLTFPNV